ncbi:MAG: hypothetical protein IPM35_30065 [Myxococcales bacterium]|nr:hypothetical protein [Myxococcales bacterium]
MKPLALTCLSLLVFACSSTSENTGSGGGGSGNTGGGNTGGSGGTSGGAGGGGGATGGSAGASGTGAVAGTGGTAGATGGGGGSTGGSGGATGGTGGATGGTGGATGGTGGATGGTGGTGTCPNGTCEAGETLASCVADCGAWRFIDTNVATALSIKGDLTFKAGGGLDQSYITSAGGAPGSCVGCSYTLGSSGLALKLPADASGGVSSSGDVAVASYHNTPQQIVMVRKGSNMNVNPAKGATYQFFGVMLNGTAANEQFGVRGQVVFDANGCLPKSNTNTTSTLRRVDGAGAVLDITLWGPGGTGAGNGCLTVGTDGVATLDHMQTTKTPSEGAYVFSGWMAAGGNEILLTRTSGGFKAGTFLLIKQGSGMSNASTNGTYYVSHLVGGASKLGVRGTVTLAGNGTASAGTLLVHGTTNPITVLNSSTYAVNANGALWTKIAQDNGNPGIMVGHVQPTNGPVIATHQVATTTPGFADPISGPSFMLWVK